MRAGLPRPSGRLVAGLALVALLLAHIWTVHEQADGAAQGSGGLLPPLVRLEGWLYDARVRLTAVDEVDDRLAIIDIDEASLREPEQGGQGRWPWGRDRLAELIRRLVDEQGAAVVGLDIVLSGRDDSSGLPVLEALARQELADVPAYLQALKRLRPQLAHDERLAEIMATRPVVLGHAFRDGAVGSGAPPPPGLNPAEFGINDGQVLRYTQRIGLPEALQAAAPALGHLNPVRDEDGLTRRVPLFVEYEDRWHPALAVVMLQQLMGAPPQPVVADYGAGRRRVEAVELGPLALPVDRSVASLVPFRAGSQRVPYISATQVLRGELPAQSLQGRLVLVGTSAPALADLVSTPVAASLPGVEVHAHLLAGALDGRLLRQPPWVLAAELLLVLTVGALVLAAGAVAARRHSPLWLIGGGLLVTCAASALNLALLTQAQLLLPLATCWAAAAGLLVLQLAWGWLVESRSRRQMSGLFSAYVPPELVQRMAENPQAYSMAPVERELTVLFCDVRGFTTVSESLSPQALADYINRYLTAMSEVIRTQHQGTLDKYIGDAVMAFWGAPVAEPRHAEQATAAALAMQSAAHTLNAEFQARGWPALHIGVGVNSGPMRVGDMGSQLRRAYTVMGDAVNLGSRLEGLTKAYGVGVLIGETTRAALSGWVCREVDRVRVKGKHQSVAIFEPVGPEASLAQQVKAEVDQWHETLALIRQQRFTEALSRLQQLQHQADRPLYALYSQRIADWRRSPPPPDWDGATNFETK